MISSMSISLTVFSSLLFGARSRELVEVAQVRRVAAATRACGIERDMPECRCPACVIDLRDEACTPEIVHVVADREVARRCPTPPPIVQCAADVGAAGDAGAAGDRGVRADRARCGRPGSGCRASRRPRSRCRRARRGRWWCWRRSRRRRRCARAPICGIFTQRPVVAARCRSRRRRSPRPSAGCSARRACSRRRSTTRG